MGLLGRFRKPKAKLSLKTERREFVLGEEVKGKLEVKSEEELDIEGIAVALYCDENVKENSIKSTIVQKLKLKRIAYTDLSRK